jgi:nitrilase
MSGGAAIIGPDTKYIEGPAGPDVEIISAEFDPGITRESSLLMDTDGHYSRPDVFTLNVNRTAQVNVVENRNATGE